MLPEEELTAHHECAGAQEIVFILKVQPIVLPFPETSSLSYTPRVLLYSGHCCSVTQSCPILCNPLDCSTPGLPVPHHLSEFAQVHVH